MISKKLKEYILDDRPFGQLIIRVPENCCLFCKHCNDVFWDHSHGPYMRFCNLLDQDANEEYWHCEKFEEEDEE